MGAVHSFPFELAVCEGKVSPALLSDRWSETHRSEIATTGEGLDFLRAIATEMRLYKNDAPLNSTLANCIDFHGNFRFGDLMILFHDYMDKRDIKSSSGLYKDLQMVASRSQDRDESRNVLVAEADAHSLPPVAAGSELSELMLTESSTPTSFFSLLPRDLLNSSRKVYGYAQKSQLFRAGLKKRFEVTELVLFDPHAFRVRQGHCVVFHENLNAQAYPLQPTRDLYLRVLSLQTGQCVWQSSRLNWPIASAGRSFCVADAGHIFVSTVPNEIAVFLPPYRNPVCVLSFINPSQTLPLLRAVGKEVFVMLDLSGIRYWIASVLGMENPDWASWHVSYPIKIRNPYQSEESVTWTVTLSENHGNIALIHSFYFMIVIFLSLRDRPHTILQLNREQHPNPLVVGSYLVFADTGAVIVYSLDDLSAPLKSVSMLPCPNSASERGFIRLGRLPFARVGAFYSSPNQNNSFLSVSPDADDAVCTDLTGVDLKNSFPYWLLNGDTLMVESCGDLNWISLRTGKTTRPPQQISTASTSVSSMVIIGDAMYTTGLTRLVCWEPRAL